MNEESRPSTSPPEDENTHTAEESSAAPEQEPTNAPSSLSPVVLVLGFIIIALLGYLIFQSIIPEPKSRNTTSSPKLQSLKADIETQRQMLNRERLALGMEPIDGGTGAESADAVAERVKEDAATLASLVTSFQDLLERKDSQLDESRAETVTALKEQRRLRDMVESLNTDLREAMIDASLASTMKSDLDRSQARLAAVQDELTRLRAEPEELRRQLAECNDVRGSLEASVADLEAKLARTSLFAGTETQMFKEAVELFRSLRNLEGRTESEISTAYSQFGARIGANVLKTCSFESGSSEIPPELESGILEIPGEAPEQALILVVGYASETGDVYNNRTLSSDRATAVARVINASKRPGQKVQAVYIGQTNRFSSEVPERNQIVEIWQIATEAR